jgi:2-dehydropantoate 2-reductase
VSTQSTVVVPEDDPLVVSVVSFDDEDPDVPVAPDDLDDEGESLESPPEQAAATIATPVAPNIASASLRVNRSVPRFHQVVIGSGMRGVCPLGAVTALSALCKSAPMRFVVIGAGAVGGVVGARLHQHGHEVVLVARGAHHDAVRADGLRLVAPEESVTLALTVHPSPAEVEFRDGDVVLLCVKSQDTLGVLQALEPVMPYDTPIVCLQNGVANEREGLRHFPNVYGVCVVLPAEHLEPGVVIANAAPTTGILDIGCAPTGVDATARAIADAFSSSAFASEPRADVMRWKYSKLLNNLGNAIDALLGSEARAESPGSVSTRARAEGEAVLAAAGIEAASREEDAARRGEMFRWRGPAAGVRAGSSSWQSLARGTGAIETDYLNGEIVLLGRLHGVPTPVNAALQRLANDAARRGVAPGTTPVEDVIRAVEHGE